ncbi:IclR family transcriptional regulator [Microbaculum marinum]|uniref:IclR family transcriptional regulator n=1 Tax=Microbaculum marinum TaxID=1764581 RepID=A0AAW9RK07_9HYPH
MSDDRQPAGIQSLKHAFDVIEEMAAIGEPVGVTELAKALGIPKTRTFRYLRTLKTLGYVSQDDSTEKYRLTLRLFHLGQAVADSTRLLTEARAAMVQLRKETGQTATLSVIESGGVRVLDIVRAQSPVQIVTRPGALLEFHSSAQGRVALAFGAPGLWKTVRGRQLSKWTPHTNTDLGVLEAEVAKARERGWATAPEQVLVGVNALAAPIFDASRELIATITVAGSLQHVPAEPPEHLRASVLQAARRISENLGCTEYPV